MKIVCFFANIVGVISTNGEKTGKTSIKRSSRSFQPELNFIWILIALTLCASKYFCNVKSENGNSLRFLIIYDPFARSFWPAAVFTLLFEVIWTSYSVEIISVWFLSWMRFKLYSLQAYRYFQALMLLVMIWHYDFLASFGDIVIIFIWFSDFVPVLVCSSRKVKGQYRFSSNNTNNLTHFTRLLECQILSNHISKVV